MINKMAKICEGFVPLITPDKINPLPVNRVKGKDVYAQKVDANFWLQFCSGIVTKQRKMKSVKNVRFKDLFFKFDQADWGYSPLEGKKFNGLIYDRVSPVDVFDNFEKLMELAGVKTIQDNKLNKIIFNLPYLLCGITDNDYQNSVVAHPYFRIIVGTTIYEADTFYFGWTGESSKRIIRCSYEPISIERAMKTPEDIWIEDSAKKREEILQTFEEFKTESWIAKALRGEDVSGMKKDDTSHPVRCIDNVEDSVEYKEFDNGYTKFIDLDK